MLEKIKSWEFILEKIYEKEYFKKLITFLKEEYKKKCILPVQENIFNAFHLCDFNSLKAVIIGQDPYANKNYANGLCFSVNKNTFPLPKSLQNIFKEIKKDVGDVDFNNGDLSRWAEQGVLLLNTTLTVVEGEPKSHFGKGWEAFSDEIIVEINKNKTNIVYFLWGKIPQKKISFIDRNKNLILTAAHPSPLSAYRGFFGCQHFSKCNEYLKKKRGKPICWF